MAILKKRAYTFKQRNPFGVARGTHSAAQGFYEPQRAHPKDVGGESAEGRERARARKRRLRRELGRRPTPKELRAAKKAEKAAAAR